MKKLQRQFVGVELNQRLLSTGARSKLSAILARPLQKFSSDRLIYGSTLRSRECLVVPASRADRRIRETGVNSICMTEFVRHDAIFDKAPGTGTDN
jgi:hypothetical protein